MLLGQYGRTLKQKENHMAKVINQYFSKCEHYRRIVNCLELGKINTIEELSEKSAVELLSIRNFGQSCLDEVSKVLWKHGFRVDYGKDLRMKCSRCIHVFTLKQEHKWPKEGEILSWKSVDVNDPMEIITIRFSAKRIFMLLKHIGQEDLFGVDSVAKSYFWGKYEYYSDGKAQKG